MRLHALKSHSAGLSFQSEGVESGGDRPRELSFLPDLPVLAEVILKDNPITDLTPLLDCPWLERLILSQQHQSLAQDQLEQAPFEIVFE